MDYDQVEILALTYANPHTQKLSCFLGFKDTFKNPHVKNRNPNFEPPITDG